MNELHLGCVFVLFLGCLLSFDLNCWHNSELERNATKKYKKKIKKHKLGKPN